MTHFIGAVLAPSHLAKDFRTKQTRFPGLDGPDALEVEPGDDLQAHLSEVLAKFDEGREVDLWISRDELIAKERKRIESYRTTRYAEYLADPEAYLADCQNPAHAEYIANAFPLELAWTDDQCWAHAVRGEEVKDLRPDGSLHSTYNPDSKWDWWTIGGRWESNYHDRQGETVDAFLTVLRETAAKLASGENCNPHKGDPDAEGGDLPWYFPQHLLTTDQTWHEVGTVGWFGFRGEDMSALEWVNHAIDALEHEDRLLSVFYIDFHI